MPRLSVSPRRDWDSPLVDVSEDAPWHVRLGLTAFRWYLILVFVIGLLTGLSWLLFAFSGLA